MEFRFSHIFPAFSLGGFFLCLATLLYQLTSYFLLLISLDFAMVSFTKAVFNIFYIHPFYICFMIFFTCIIQLSSVFLPKIFLVSGFQNFEEGCHRLFFGVCGQHSSSGICHKCIEHLLGICGNNPPLLLSFAACHSAFLHVELL